MRDPPYLTNVKLAKLSAVRLHHIKYSTVLVSSATGEQDHLGEARVYGTPGNGADLRMTSVEVNAVCLGSPQLFFCFGWGLRRGGHGKKSQIGYLGTQRVSLRCSSRTLRPTRSSQHPRQTLGFAMTPNTHLHDPRSLGGAFQLRKFIENAPLGPNGKEGS